MAAVVQQLQRLSAACVLAALPALAAAQSITLAGRMGDRALLVVDGQPQTVAVGQSTASGVKLLRWVNDSVEVERNGVRQLLRTGMPAQTNAAPPRQSAREVVLTAGPGGHFVAEGAINGKAVRFMVDTGATLVALGLDDAARLGIDLAQARTARFHTANGEVRAQLVMLDRVRVGDVELTNIGAAVMPQAMPMVLLGNSFLSRLQMQRDNDVMRLQLR